MTTFWFWVKSNKKEQNVISLSKNLFQSIMISEQSNNSELNVLTHWGWILQIRPKIYYARTAGGKKKERTINTKRI